MINIKNYHVVLKIVAITFVLTAVFFAFSTTHAETTGGAGGGGGSSDPTPQTVDLHIYKKIDGDNPLGYQLDEFSYHIQGGSVDEIVPHDTVIPLPVGTYTIEELVPDGFLKGQWRVNWYAGGCDPSGSDEYVGTIEIEESDLGRFNSPLSCEANNQYRPARIPLVKELINDGGGTAKKNDFSFMINGGEPISFNESGIMSLEVEPGTYTITEVEAPGYTTTYQGCVDIELGFEEQSDTCTITNTYNDGELEVCDDPYALNYLEEGSCEYEEGRGVITIVKEVVSDVADWSFDFTGDLNEFTLTDSTTSVTFTDLESDLEYVVNETVPEGWSDPVVSCDDDNSGEEENDQLVVSLEDGEHVTCTFTNRLPDGPQCIDENPGWADYHHDVNQGLRNDGGPVLAGRSNPDDVLGAADWSNGGSTGFFSLGFGGSIVIEFEKYVSDEEGDDISIHEATNGTYPVEKAKVEVSQNGTDWYELTEEASNDKDEGGDNVTLLDFSETGLPWVKYVRITDTTESGLHNDEADGFDLDAVDAVSEVCDEPGGGDNGGGDGDDDVDLYRIEGYVWHDNNENTIWDGFQDEEATTTEDGLTGWTVKITNGVETYSTTTDPDGFYYFEVPAGTWTITEETQSGWTLITPVSGSFVVTVPEVMTQSLMGRVFAFFFPTAHAAVLDTLGLFNFGNNESDGGGISVSGGGGGGSSSPRCVAFTASDDGGGVLLEWKTSRGEELVITGNGTELYSTKIDSIVDDGSFLAGGGTEFELTVSRGSRKDTCTASLGGGGSPEGQVLGEQVSVVPLGAADTGAGGGAPIPQSVPLSFVAAILRTRGGVVRNARNA